MLRGERTQAVGFATGGGQLTLERSTELRLGVGVGLLLEPFTLKSLPDRIGAGAPLALTFCVAIVDEALQRCDLSVNGLDRRRARLLPGKQFIPAHLQFQQLAGHGVFDIELDCFRDIREATRQ